MSARRSDHWDFVRGISILGMMLIHTRDLLGWEPFGINFHRVAYPAIEPIFFLSGFLITSRTLKYLEIPGLPLSRVMTNFFIRRVVRTWPLYFTFVAFCFAFPSMVERPIEKPLWTFLTFTMNVDLPISGLVHIWSLCVEEWCYLLFLPLIGFLHFRWVSWAFWALAGVAIFSRGLVLVQSGPLDQLTYFTKFHFSTIRHWDSFWLGCLGSLFYQRFGPSGRRAQLGFLAMALAGTAAYCGLWLVTAAFFLIRDLLSPEIGAFISFGLILGIGAVPAWCLRATGLVRLGYISYSVYLTHMISLHGFASLNREYDWIEPLSYAELLFSYAGVFLVGAVVFFLFQRPILNLLQTRFQLRPRPESMVSGRQTAV